MFTISLFFLFLLFSLRTVHLTCLQSDFQATINTDTDAVTVHFTPFSIRSSNFGVYIQSDDNSFFPHTAASSYSTYLGEVQGYPGAMASGLLQPNGTLLCRISFENGVEWSSTGGGLAKVRGSTNWKPQWPTIVIPATSGDSIIFEAEVGVDASHAAFLASNSSIDDVIAMAEYSILAANVPFLRDASILHTVGKVVVRASKSRDPYQSADTGDLLTTVRNLWNGELAPIVGKTHQLALVSRPGANGGLAWLSSVGTSNGFSANDGDANGDFSIYWRHEAGHNWGSDHYEGGGRPEGPTIMSDNQLSRFSSPELSRILQFKSSVPQLATSLIIPRPPRANTDLGISLTKDSIHLDVLANDFDADIQSLGIVSVQNPSAMNSITQISQGSRDQIFYTPSFLSALSTDYFTYTIQNANLKTSTAYAIVRPKSLMGWWKLDEKEGANAQDSSGNLATGSITGSTSWDHQAGGLAFEGAGMLSLGTKPSLGGTTSFSVSVWVKVPTSVDHSNMVIIQQRSPPNENTNGYNGEYQLYLENGKSPRFMVFGDNNWQFDFTAPADINDGQWHHIVAMRDSKEGRIYIDGEFSASKQGNNVNLDGNIPVFMGWDARDKTSFFKGSLFGARIYSRALSKDEVKYLSTRPEALVGWWKMNEKSGTSLQDYSGNLATGQVTGSTSWDPSGGLVFKGAGKVSFGIAPSLTGKTSFSIHAWVRVENGASKSVIIQQRGPQSSTTSGFNGQYQLYLQDGRPSFMVFGDGGWQFDFSASTAVNDGQWHHIIAVRDQKEGRIYVDGQLSGSATSGDVKNLDGNIPVFMGCDARDLNGFFSGSIKGVKIYNQVVTRVFSEELVISA